MVQTYNFTDYKGTEKDLDAFFTELYEAEKKIERGNIYQYTGNGFCDDPHEAKTEIIKKLLEKHNVSYA